MRKWDKPEVAVLDINQTANGVWASDQERDIINIGDGYLFGSHESCFFKKQDNQDRPRNDDGSNGGGSNGGSDCGTDSLS